MIAETPEREEYLRKLFDTSGDRDPEKRGLDDVEDCREEIREYCYDIDSRTTITEKTKKAYKQNVRWFNAWLDYRGIEDLTEISRREVRSLLRDLAATSNGTTGNDRWQEIRKLYDDLVLYKEIEDNPLEPFHKKRGEYGIDRKSEKGERLNDMGRKAALSRDEVRQLEKKVGRPRERNQLIIRLLWQTGLRRDELSRIKYVDDYDFPGEPGVPPEDEERWEQTDCDIDIKNRLIRVRAKVSKTSTERIVSYRPTCRELIEDWIEIGRADALDARTEEKYENGQYDDDPDTDYLFYGINGDRLSGDAINNVVLRAADNADIQEYMYKDENGGWRTRISAHALRHGLGHYLVHHAGPDEDGIDIYKVSKILGHSSVDVTEDIYAGHKSSAGLLDLSRWGPE